MSIYLLTFSPPIHLPDATDASLELARLFGKPTITPIPADTRRNVTPSGMSGRLELRTYQCPGIRWVDTIGEIRVYNHEEENSSGSAEQREQAVAKEVLIDTKIIDAHHMLVPIAKFDPSEKGVTLEGIVMYESSGGKGDDLTV